MIRTVASIDEVVAGKAAQVVVNCLGMAAKELVPDPEVYPCRGELLHVSAPWIQAAKHSTKQNTTTTQGS